MHAKTAVRVVLVTILLLGCATGRVDLVETGTIQAEAVPTREVSVSRVRAYEEEGQLLVTGAVWLQGWQYASEDGQVEVTIYGPDGRIWGEKFALYHPRDILTLRLSRSAPTFTARFPGVPPPGSKVRAVFRKTDRS